MVRGNWPEMEDERVVKLEALLSSFRRTEGYAGKLEPVCGEVKCVKRMPSRERAVYLAYQTDWKSRALREQCLAKGAKGNRARRVSAVRRLLPPPSSVERKPVLLGPMRWVDVAGRALRRRWMARLSSAIC